MAGLLLHHVSIVVRDLNRSLDFYMETFGFARLDRPPFKTVGGWLAIGDRQLHLIVWPDGNFRKSPAIDINDAHFALRTDDFAGVVGRLERLGFREDRPDGDPKKYFLNRGGLAGFEQLYLLDPDYNIIEVNSAPMA